MAIISDGPRRDDFFLRHLSRNTPTLLFILSFDVSCRNYSDIGRCRGGLGGVKTGGGRKVFRNRTKVGPPCETITVVRIAPVRGSWTSRLAVLIEPDLHGG